MGAQPPLKRLILSKAAPIFIHIMGCQSVSAHHAPVSRQALTLAWAADDIAATKREI